MLQQGSARAPAHHGAGCSEGTAAAVQRVWLAVAAASGLGEGEDGRRDFPAAAASDRRRVTVKIRMGGIGIAEDGGNGARISAPPPWSTAGWRVSAA